MMMGLGCQARRCPRLGAARLQPVAAISPASSCPRVATPGQTHSAFSSGISSRKARNVVRRRTEQLEDEQRQRTVAQAGDNMDIDGMGGPTAIPMPNIFWRAFAAFMYIIPWIDMLGLGRWVFHQFPWSIILYYLPGPFVAVYYFNQWMPLIVFFLVFLSVVKNTKLHHFVRFNSMQAIMIDICTMLVLIVKMYLPAEIRWTWISVAFASIGWWLSMTLILYCVFFTLKGQYADIPFVSDAVYTQIDQADIM